MTVPGYPPPTRNIQVFVDSVALLGGAPQAQCAFLCDDGETSDGQGSATLATSVVAGQLVSWHLIPIDLQAPAWIAGIDFGAAQPPDGVGAGMARPAWACRWEGYVPLHVMAGQVYPYRMMLTFVDGSGPPVRIEGMKLTIADPLPSYLTATGQATIGDSPEAAKVPDSSAAMPAHPAVPAHPATPGLIPIWRESEAPRGFGEVL